MRLLTGVVLAVTLTACGGGGAKHVATFAASHDLVVTAQFDAEAAATNECGSAGNMPGQLTVKNQAGTILGVADLAEPRSLNDSTCQGDYRMTVPDATFYVLDVAGSSGHLTYPRKDLEDQGWHLAISP